MLCATYLHAIGYNVGMCNHENGLNLKEIPPNTKVLLMGEWMDVLKGRTERSEVPNGLWPLHPKVNHKRLTLTLSSLNTPAHIILSNNVPGACQDRRTSGLTEGREQTYSPQTSL